MAKAQQESEALLSFYRDCLASRSLDRNGKAAWNRLQEIGLSVPYSGQFKTPSDLSFWKPFEAKGEEQFFPLSDTSLPTVVMVNGRVVRELSSSVMREWEDGGAGKEKREITPLSEAMELYGIFLGPRSLQEMEQERDPLALLNAIFYPEGAFIYLPPESKEAIEIIHLITPEAEGLILPRVHVVLGRHASLTVYERWMPGPIRGPIWGYSVIDWSLEEGSQGKLYTALCKESGEQTWWGQTLRGRVKKNASLVATRVGSGFEGMLHKVEVDLLGEGADVDLKGAWALHRQQRSHTSIRVHHQAPHCHSSQLFKGVVDGRARSSFEGKIQVDSKAQKTDAFQLNRNLLLSDQAEAHALPNLEIEADDVKASHGATTGPLQKEELFYLMTRGLTEAEARHLMVQGFLREVTVGPFEKLLNDALLPS